MHVDFKITTWERVEVPAEHEEEIKALIEDGTITSASDMFDHLDGIECEKLTYVDEQMTPEENGGCSTVEVWEQTTAGQPMERTWCNGDEDKDNV